MVCTESITQTRGRAASSVASTDASDVSAITDTDRAAGPSRSARSLTCAADSSPLTYSVLWRLRSSDASVELIRVLLPIPGEPPIRTIEPGTIPPPSTRSNSSLPVGSRSTSINSTSESFTGVGALVRPEPPGRRLPVRPIVSEPPLFSSSTRLFQAPQPGQRPIQDGATCPQSVQANWEVDRAIALVTLSSEPDELSVGAVRW